MVKKIHRNNFFTKQLNEAQTKIFQQSIGVLIYYYHITDHMTLFDFNCLQSYQDNITDEIEKSNKRCIDFLDTFNVTITYKNLDMML